MPKIKKIARISAPLLLIVLGIVIFMALVKTRPAATTQTPPDTRISVDAQAVKLGDHRPELSLYGRISSPSLVKLSTALNADIIELAVKEGDNISADQLLLKLDDREIRWLLAQQQAEHQNRLAQLESEQNRYRADQELLLQEQALLELAQQAEQRAEALETRSLGSQSSLDEFKQNTLRQALAVANRQQAIADHPARLKALQALRDQAQSRLQQSRLQLEDTQLTSPFDGRVAKVHVAQGQHLRQGTAVMDIFDDSQLEIRAPLPSAWIGTLRGLPPGTLAASARIDGQDYQLRLSRLAANMESTRGGIDAFFRFDNSSRGLALGRVVELQLSLPVVGNSFLLPSEALYGTDRVYKIVDQSLRAIKVTHRGNRVADGQDGRVILTSPDIQDGDRLLINKFATATDGLPVKAR